MREFNSNSDSSMGIGGSSIGTKEFAWRVLRMRRERRALRIGCRI